MKTKKLTFIEAVMLIAGAGIGTGILTIPYAVEQIGIFGTLIALLFAYVVSILMYLIIADLTVHSKKSNDLIGILEEHLFKGKSKVVMKITFFILLILLLIENLVVYILCASNVLTDLLGIPLFTSKIIFYSIASSIIFFGVKGIGIGEKYSVILIGAIIGLLIIFSFENIQNRLNISFGEPRLIFAIYGLFMFAFSAIFSIIQVCNHIENKSEISKAVILGLSVNAGITLLFSVVTIIGSEKVTEIATIGLSESLNFSLIKIICSVFVLLAMLSSFWSSGLAFAEVLEQQTNLSKTVSWFISTLPTVIIAIILPLSILDYIQIGAGALSIILVIVVLPAYYNAVKASDHCLLGKFAKSKLLISTVAIAICLMCISSFITIN